MTGMRYQDFDLVIETAGDHYRACVVRSPAGEAATAFTLPFTPLEQENFLLRMGRPRRGVRGGSAPEVNTTRAFGLQLYNAVFSGSVQDAFVRSLDRVQSQGDGLRLRLRLNNVPALVDLPWEYLYDPTMGRFLAHSTETPIIRYLDLPQQITPLLVRPPLNVLVVIAAPHDVEALDVDAEWHNIERALADLVARQQIALTLLTTATLGALQQLLRRHQFHILHFVGHGSFDAQSDAGVLFFEDEAEHSRSVSGLYLGTLLHDHPSLRLVLLNACEGARTTAADPFAGVAQQLVRQGIPAVIAMQFEISDRAATTLASEFYGAIADGYPVDAALAEARKALFLQEQSTEWGTPVLYMRTDDGRIFAVVEPTSAAAAVITAPTTPTDTPATTAVGNGPWRSKRTILAAALGVLAVIAWLVLRDFAPGVPVQETRVGSATQAVVPIAALPTATITATAVPVPVTNGTTVLFRHTFEDPADDWGDNTDGAWLVLDDGTGNHVYQGHATSAPMVASDPPEQESMAHLADYAITMRMRIINAGLPNDDFFDAWLAFRHDVKSADGCAYYDVYFDARLNQVLLSSANRCDFTVLATVPYNLDPGIWYVVRVATIGTRISVAIDGNPLIAVDDTASARGTYYLNVGQGAIVQFDDIQVEKLS